MSYFVRVRVDLRGGRAWLFDSPMFSYLCDAQSWARAQRGDAEITIMFKDADGNILNVQAHDEGSKL